MFKRRGFRVHGRALPMKTIDTLTIITNMMLRGNLGYLSGNGKQGFINKTMKDIRWYSLK